LSSKLGVSKLCYKKNVIKKLASFTVLVVLFFQIQSAFAQSNQAQVQQKPKMTFLGQFDAGSPNAGIFKVYDPTDQVLCYILMPEAANRKTVNNVVLYEGNSLGSISCLKVSPNEDLLKQGADLKQAPESVKPGVGKNINPPKK
jgi:hypothetical protein